MLSRAGVREAESEIERFIRNTDSGGPAVNRETDYLAVRLDMQKIPNYDRVMSAIRVVEWMPGPAYRDALDRLLDDPHIKGNVNPDPLSGDRRFCMGLLELRLSHAAHLCGSSKGTRRLRAYLKDYHVILRRYAFRCLAK